MQIKILTVNAAQQPCWIPGAMNKQSKRARELANKILIQAPDIVCIQELFRGESRAIIRKKLRKAYPYYYTDTRCGKYVIGVNSGLAIFSFFPIMDQKLMTYSVYRGVENFAKKGCMYTKIDISDTLTPSHDGYYIKNCGEEGPSQAGWTCCGKLEFNSTCKKVKKKYLHLFTTHLQSGIGAEPCICKYFDKNSLSSEQLKLAQIEEMDTFVNELNTSNDLIVLTGDFNIRAGTDLYEETASIFGTSLGVRDIFDEEKSPCDSSVVGKPDRRIDYIWSNVEASYSIILEPWEGVTDHHAVYGEMDCD